MLVADARVYTYWETVQAMVMSQEGETVEGRSREIVGGFPAKLSGEHTVNVVVCWFRKVWDWRHGWRVCVRRY